MRVRLLDANAAGRRLAAEEIVASRRRNAARRDRHDAGDAPGQGSLPIGRKSAGLRGEAHRRRAHATLLPDEPLDHGFDAVVVGEGEPTVVEAVEAVLGRAPLDAVKGLVYRGSDGRIHHNEPRPPIADLDSLPPPARHLVDPADFGATADLHAHIFTSRGCPGRCAYCAGGLFGKKFRFRSADSVVDEMIALHRDYGTRQFYFVDDAMSMDRDRMRRICRRLIDERLGFTWHMMTRIDAVDEELLDLAARAGCVQIEYGVESGNPDTLKRIHKPHTVEMARRVIPMTRRHGIRPVVFFILGFPWESPQAIDATLELMGDLAPTWCFCRPSPRS